MIHGFLWGFFSPVVPQNSISPVRQVSSALDKREQMKQTIVEVASACSGFSHRAVRYSSTAERQLLKSTYASAQHSESRESYIKNIEQDIKAIRDKTKTKLNDCLKSGIACEEAWIQAYSEQSIAVIKTSRGNCAEKAVLAGIFLKATLSKELKASGFSDKEIDDADIKIQIGNLGTYGDHCVCVLTHEIDAGFHIVDPWMNGAVYDITNARDIFTANLKNPDMSYEFGYRRVPSDIVNHIEIVDRVMVFAKDFLGRDEQFSGLFK